MTCYFISSRRGDFFFFFLMGSIYFFRLVFQLKSFIRPGGTLTRSVPRNANCKSLFELSLETKHHWCPVYQFSLSNMLLYSIQTMNINNAQANVVTIPQLLRMSNAFNISPHISPKCGKWFYHLSNAKSSQMTWLDLWQTGILLLISGLIN